MPTPRKGPPQAEKKQAATPATPPRNGGATEPATPEAEPVTPTPGRGHFPRLPEESEAEHRGFLLWAMQTPGIRSYRLTAKAAGVTDTSVRRWAERRSWSSRVEGLTRSDGLAWRAWLRDYADSAALSGISIVQANMKLEGPLTPLAYLRQHLSLPTDPTAYPKESTARAVLEAAADTSRRVMGDRLPGDEEDDEPLDPALGGDPLAGGDTGGGEGATNPVGGKPGEGGGRGQSASPPTPAMAPQGSHTPATARDEATDPTARRGRVREFRTLIQSTLGIYAQDVKHTLNPKQFPNGKEVRVTPKDVPVLIELAQALEEIPESAATSQGPMESVRVRIAREKGEDVLEALGRDHEEMGVILEALNQKKAQEAEHLRQELARSQGAEVVPLREEAG